MLMIIQVLYPGATQTDKFGISMSATYKTVCSHKKKSDYILYHKHTALWIHRQDCSVKIQIMFDCVYDKNNDAWKLMHLKETFVEHKTVLI